MNRSELIGRVRSLTRDLSNAIFREVDIIDYINEAIERTKQIIAEFNTMVDLKANDDSPILLPKEYHHLLAVYSASRCFGQDERHYQASNLMNEFETKMHGLKEDIEGGNIVIVDPDTGEPIVKNNPVDYVRDIYFTNRHSMIDVDNGVEGVRS